MRTKLFLACIIAALLSCGKRAPVKGVVVDKVREGGGYSLITTGQSIVTMPHPYSYRLVLRSVPGDTTKVRTVSDAIFNSVKVGDTIIVE